MIGGFAVAGGKILYEILSSQFGHDLSYADQQEQMLIKSGNPYAGAMAPLMKNGAIMTGVVNATPEDRLQANIDFATAGGTMMDVMNNATDRNGEDYQLAAGWLLDGLDSFANGGAFPGLGDNTDAVNALWALGKDKPLAEGIVTLMGKIIPADSPLSKVIGPDDPSQVYYRQALNDAIGQLRSQMDVQPVENFWAPMFEAYDSAGVSQYYDDLNAARRSKDFVSWNTGGD